MKLSDQDKAALALLMKQEHQWHRFRYVNLALGIINLFLAFGGFLFLLIFSSSNAHQFISHPAFYILAGSGGAAIGCAVRGWRGTPANRLLISVVTELTSNDRHAPLGADERGR